MTNSPNLYGITAGTKPCYSSSNGKVCKNPNQFLYFDTLHPVTTVHQCVQLRPFYFKVCVLTLGSRAQAHGGKDERSRRRQPRSGGDSDRPRTKGSEQRHRRRIRCSRHHPQWQHRHLDSFTNSDRFLRLVLDGANTFLYSRTFACVAHDLSLHLLDLLYRLDSVGSLVPLILSSLSLSLVRLRWFLLA